MELWLLFSAHPLTVLIFLPSSMKISQSVSKLLSGHDFQGKRIQKKNAGGIMVPVLCSLPHNALYLYQIL